MAASRVLELLKDTSARREAAKNGAAERGFSDSFEETAVRRKLTGRTAVRRSSESLEKTACEKGN